jgi:hypothetical protein
MKNMSKNLTELNHCKRMVEVVSFLVFTEYAKYRLVDKKQYPKFDLKESEEKIQKYKNSIYDYKVKIEELELKEERRVENKIKKEIGLKSKNSKLKAVEWLEENLKLNMDFRTTLLFEIAKEMEKKQIVDAVEDCNYGNGTEYYNETYGSNSEKPNVVSFQTISDEEIEKNYL